MEEQNKNSEQETEQSVDSETQNRRQSRNPMLMILAGAYLLYTGYQLCKNVLDGVEGAKWGFFAAGVGFLVIGAGMIFFGGRDSIRRDKEKRAMEEAQEAQKAQETPAEKKSMSIAERARLGETLRAEEVENCDSEQTEGLKEVSEE